MSIDRPTVSVVMAAYNGAAFIGETIATVLAQTMPDLEIVVVDDGSKDDTLGVLAAIADPRLRVIRAPCNGGPAVARTIAMEHARGRFIAGLDQDDFCRPDRFARQLAYLAAHPDVVLVGSMIDIFGDKSGRLDPYPRLVDSNAIDWLMTILNPLAWSTTMMRGEAARALTPFERDERRFAEDFDLYQRIRAHGRIGRVAEPLVRYRVHPGGASRAFEEKMILSAGQVLADRYGTIFDGGELVAGTLMSRHAAARHAPPDIDTLADCGRVLARLLEVHGGLAPAFSGPNASEIWWRIARTGLRAGHYGIADVLRTHPAFARAADAMKPVLAADVARGATRRMLRR